MTLEEKLLSDIKDAMKSKQMERLNTLRLVKSALENQKMQKKTEKLSDEQVLEVFTKQVKQRKESLESFEKAGRVDLAAKEKQEIDILAVYLPAQLSDDEIKAEVELAIKEVGATVKADAGKVMQVLMPRLKGKADGKKVNSVLMSALE